MKEKDLVTFYKVFSNLYGAILDKDAYQIIKKYFPDFTYEELMKDLKNRSRRSNKYFVVKKWDKESYVIRGEINNKETKELFLMQENKPFFTTETFDEYKEFIYYINMNKQTTPTLKSISNLCLKYFDYYNRDFAKTLAFAVAEDTQIYVLNRYNPTEVLNHLIKNNGINFSDNDKKEFLRLYNELDLLTRTWANRGHTGKSINEYYYYDILFRPILKKAKDHFLANLKPEEIDVDYVEMMLNRAKTFTPEEIVFIKKEVHEMASHNLNFAA